MSSHGILHSDRPSGEHNTGHVHFDEAVISEHDKLRGTRQKIDEPDTPFHRGSFDDNVDMQDTEELLNETASSVKVVFNNDTAGHVVPKQGGAGDNELGKGALDMQALQSKLGEADAVPTAAKASAESDFANKRKQHYNEYEMLRKWREEHADEDDE
mmetsp:Transcript_14331/g.23363  ORF Transcript_14331/g.23363 Transcript_14331/m.23363 type:complete len:157 (+) Transcript_14331:183-653(+)